jgi:uncharacterized phage protein gp47/JayE
MPDYVDFIPFVSETADTIRARMNADLNAGLAPTDPGFIDLTPGSMGWDLTQGPVLEIERAYETMNELGAAAFPAFAWGVYLDYHAATLGLERKDENPATGTVTFTGTPGHFIPADFQVAAPQTDPTADPIVFSTTTSGTIPAGGFIDLPVQAAAAGSLGNVAANLITVKVTPDNNVTAVTNADPTSGGADIESDDLLRNRIFVAWAGGHGAGTQADYEGWALAFEGVGFATVVPLWIGTGTVHVIVTDTNNQPVTGDVVSGLQAEIDPQNLQTTSVGAHVLPVTVLNVASTAGAAPQGRLVVGQEGSKSLVTYTGLTSQVASPAAPTVAAGSAGALTGAYRYKVTFVTAQGETQGGAEAGPVTLAAQQANLTNIPLGPTGTTSRKIYRTAAGGATGTEKLVHTISDNTTTTYTDNNADGTLTTAVPTENSTAAFTGCTGGTGTLNDGDPVVQSGLGAGLAPVGALVTVSTTQFEPINVTVALTLSSGFSYDGAGGTAPVRDDVTTALQDYLNSLPPGGTVVYQHIVATLFSVVGVIDVSGLTVNGGAANIALGPLNSATLGTLTLS